MRCLVHLRRRCAWSLLSILTVGLTACSPGVSDIDLSSTRTRGEAARARLEKMDAELKALNGEVKALTGFSGPEHEARMQKAAEMRQEMAELESIKAEVDAKVARFTTEAKAHRDALSKENP